MDKYESTSTDANFGIQWEENCCEMLGKGCVNSQCIFVQDSEKIDTREEHVISQVLELPAKYDLQAIFM